MDNDGELFPSEHDTFMVKSSFCIWSTSLAVFPSRIRSFIILYRVLKKVKGNPISTSFPYVTVGQGHKNG